MHPFAVRLVQKTHHTEPLVVTKIYQNPSERSRQPSKPGALTKHPEMELLSSVDAYDPVATARLVI
jgi:hypothetical protein